MKNVLPGLFCRIWQQNLLATSVFLLKMCIDHTIIIMLPCNFSLFIENFVSRRSGLSWSYNYCSDYVSLYCLLNALYPWRKIIFLLTFCSIITYLHALSAWCKYEEDKSVSYCLSWWRMYRWHNSVEFDNNTDLQLLSFTSWMPVRCYGFF
jgi:hypothetical protein